MSKGAATIAHLARAVETLKRRDRETRARIEAVNNVLGPAPIRLDQSRRLVYGLHRSGVLDRLHDLEGLVIGLAEAHRVQRQQSNSPATVTPPPAATPVRTTSVPARSHARSFLVGARHSVTRALSFFSRLARRSETGSRDAVSCHER